MTKLIYIKIRNLFTYIITSFIVFCFSFYKREIIPKTLLLIRLDAIGDYILFRNFLKVIRNSQKYKDYKITLLGNYIWKEIALTFDKDVIDGFIWLNRKKFYGNILYRCNLLSQLYKSGFETVIEATHSREILYGDMVVGAVKAKNSIGSKGSGEKYTAWKRKLFTDKLYTTLISIPKDDLFEFEVNKKLYANLLGQEINITKPDLDTSCVQPLVNLRNKYIVLFPGASNSDKMWSCSNFRNAADYILNNYPFDVVLSGSSREGYLFNEIVNSNFQSRFINYFGCSLPELAKLISEAELLISNDTSAIHFAAAVNTPFICISNGSYFGRFHPYPEGMLKYSHYIYPDQVFNILNKYDESKVKEQLRFESCFNINDIKPEKVIEIIKTVLN